jgi:hypothetical protein
MHLLANDEKVIAGRRAGNHIGFMLVFAGVLRYGARLFSTTSRE